MASSTNEYARRSANRRMTRFCEETGNNRHSSRMTPLNMLLAEQAESDAVRRRSTLINMPIVAETSNLYHSSDSGNNEANEVLTEEQIQAFQEAFALFDKDGGGTIDAAELQKTLEECEIHVDGNDLVEILMTIDHDGNGEVDFEEFLSLMTNTDIFIQAVEGGGQTEAEVEHYRKRVVLFDALTQFLRKQALQGANEIINYYSRKYRKIARNYNPGNKGAHVVGHYADVARLVGLTENELYVQLKELELKKINPKDTSSPYAQSFHKGLLRSIEQDRQKRKIIKPYGLGGPKHRQSSRQKRKTKEDEHKKEHHHHAKAGNANNCSPSRIKLQIIGIEKLESVAPERSTVCMFKQHSTHRSKQFTQAANRRKSLNAVMLKNALDLPPQHRPGWNGQRIQTINVDIVVEPGWSQVPLSWINELKKVMQTATDEYFTKTSCEKLESNLKFYRSLNTRKGPSLHLDGRVRDCMVSYSAATTNNSVGRVGMSALQRVFKKDEYKIKVQRRKEERSTVSRMRLTESLRHMSVFKLLPEIFEK